MTNNNVNNLRLGLFVSVGLAVLIIALYAVGKNQSIFGARIHLKARFRNVNGLMEGNNIRYAGIQTGTVSDIEVINDTTIEVSMLIDEKMQPYIRANATVSIGSEGLMGNKVINIIQGSQPAPAVTDGALLATASLTKTDDMLETLSVTNADVQIIAANLKEIVIRLNESKAVWEILNDTTVPQNLRLSMSNISKATERINEIAADIDVMMAGVMEGEGVAGVLLTDKSAADNVRIALENLSTVSAQANNLVADADSVVNQLKSIVKDGPGTIHSVLKDTATAGRLNRSITNVEKGTASFSENMEALKHNFLTRGYFRRQAKKAKK